MDLPTSRKVLSEKKKGHFTANKHHDHDQALESYRHQEGQPQTFPIQLESSSTTSVDTDVLQTIDNEEERSRVLFKCIIAFQVDH